MRHEEYVIIKDVLNNVYVQSLVDTTLIREPMFTDAIGQAFLFPVEVVKPVLKHTVENCPHEVWLTPIVIHVDEDKLV
jgi:hypothetical protein